MEQNPRGTNESLTEVRKKMKDRLLYAILNVVGKKGQICTKGNHIQEGFIRSIVQQGAAIKPLDPKQSSEKILQENLVSIQVKGVTMLPMRKFSSDPISVRNKSKIRQLAKWEPEQGVDQDPFELLIDQTTGNWDQFAVNKEKFGVQSTYNETLYTTGRVDQSQLSLEQIVKADKIANQLKQNKVEIEEEEDEEKLFGAVLGTGRYVNQGLIEYPESILEIYFSDSQRFKRKNKNFSKR